MEALIQFWKMITEFYNSLESGIKLTIIYVIFVIVYLLYYNREELNGRETNVYEKDNE